MRAGLVARAWRLHLFAVVAVCGCLAAGFVELRRALAGNALSWVYTGEWPLFAALGSYVWVTLVRELRGLPPRPARARSDARPGRSRSGRAADDVAHAAEPDDPELRAWRAYLTRLQADDPPGGPPW